jgi:hypothetical protein
MSKSTFTFRQIYCNCLVTLVKVRKAPLPTYLNDFFCQGAKSTITNVKNQIPKNLQYTLNLSNYLPIFAHQDYFR